MKTTSHKISDNDNEDDEEVDEIEDETLTGTRLETTTT